MIHSYILWCWIAMQDRECSAATVVLDRITHVSCEALHPPEADARISAVRSGMGEGAWEVAWREGRALTLDETVSYAMQKEGAGG